MLIHNYSCVAATGKKCTIDLGMWTIFIYLTKSEKTKKAIKDTLLMNESFLFLLFHKIFLLQMDCCRRFVIKVESSFHVAVVRRVHLLFVTQYILNCFLLLVALTDHCSQPYCCV